MKLAWLCSLLMSVALAQSPTPEADALFAKQDWTGAARAFKQVTDREPGNGRAWFRLASALYRTGEHAAARAAFNRAVENKFQAPAALAGLARSYAAENQPAQAIDWLQRAGKAGFANVAFVKGDASFSRIEAQPGFAEALRGIEKNAKPCLYTPEYQQFNFWVGEWDVQVSGQTVARSSIQSIDDGCVVQENWMPAGGIEGKSWNLYNSNTGKWEQLWMSAGNVLKLEGGLQDGAMHFEGTTPQVTGQPALEKLTFSRMPGGRVHQFWQRSTDGGKTWTVAFDGIYIPRTGS